MSGHQGWVEFQRSGQPGVRHPDAYAELTALYTTEVEALGIVVVRDAQVTVADDRIHWAFPASVGGVKTLMKALLSTATSVDQRRLSGLGS